MGRLRRIWHESRSKALSGDKHLVQASITADYGTTEHDASVLRIDLSINHWCDAELEDEDECPICHIVALSQVILDASHSGREAATRFAIQHADRLFDEFANRIEKARRFLADSPSSSTAVDAP